MLTCIRCGQTITNLQTTFIRVDNELLHDTCVQKGDKPWKPEIKAQALHDVVRQITAITNVLCADKKRRRVFVLEDLHNGYVQGYVRRKGIGRTFTNVYGLAMPFGPDDWQFVANSDVQTRTDDEGTMHFYRESEQYGHCATLKTLLDTSVVNFYAQNNPTPIFTRIFADDISVFPDHRERAIQFATLYVQG